MLISKGESTRALSGSCFSGFGKLLSRSKLSRNYSRYGSGAQPAAGAPRWTASRPDPRFLVGARLRFVAPLNRQNGAQFGS